MKKTCIKNQNLFLILLIFLSSCSVSVNLEKKPYGTDAEKDKFIKKMTQSTYLHQNTAKTSKKDVKIYPSELQGKTAAIVAVSCRIESDFDVYGSHAEYVANGFADVIRKQFSEKLNFTIIPYEAVLNNPTYRNLSFESKKERGFIAAKASAYNLIYMTVFAYQVQPKKTLEAIKVLPEALGVDYVMMARIDIYLEHKALKMTPYIRSINFDIIDKNKVVWSFSIPRLAVISVQNMKGFACPKEKIKVSFFGDKTIKNTQGLLDGIVNTFSKIMDIAIYKFEKDRKG